jgi:hypothetical protein
MTFFITPKNTHLCLKENEIILIGVSQTSVDICSDSLISYNSEDKILNIQSDHHIYTFNVLDNKLILVKYEIID